jgi:hypothetical protein
MSSLLRKLHIIYDAWIQDETVGNEYLITYGSSITYGQIYVV